jgi:glycosyltransferase involved in cell wall biosynthesis
MKVAVVTAFPRNPDSPRGGVEAVSVNLVRGLSAYPGVEIHVVTMDRISAPAVSTWSGATIHRIPRAGLSTLTEALGSGRRAITRYVLGLSPDLVHAHDTYGLMLTGLPIPKVLTIHGFIYRDTLISRTRFAWMRSQVWRWFETRAWADQQHIISISPYVRERLSGRITGTIHDIDNPISETFFDVARRERKGILFSAAVISPRKNTLALIEAFGLIAQKHPEATLRLAGPVVDEAYGQAVKKRIRELQLETRVELLGSIPSEQVRAELAASSGFVLVSLEENSPMGIEEAMAVGVPVVTSNRCGMPYMVSHGETGFLVEPSDWRGIAARLDQLLCDDGLRARMGRQARIAAEQRFHPGVVARRTYELYREMLGEAPAVAGPVSISEEQRCRT